MESLKILILEDEGPVRSVLAEKFTSLDFTVFEAANGNQALEIALKEKPTVILTDIVMFPMDGLTFLKKIRESGIWGSHVPCYVFSNHNDPELRAQLKYVDVALLISKAETPISDVAQMIKTNLTK